MSIVIHIWSRFSNESLIISTFYVLKIRFMSVRREILLKKRELCLNLSEK